MDVGQRSQSISDKQPGSRERRDRGPDGFVAKHLAPFSSPQSAGPDRWNLEESHHWHSSKRCDLAASCLCTRQPERRSRRGVQLRILYTTLFRRAVSNLHEPGLAHEQNLASSRSWNQPNAGCFGASKSLELRTQTRQSRRAVSRDTAINHLLLPALPDDDPTPDPTCSCCSAQSTRPRRVILS